MKVITQSSLALLLFVTATSHFSDAGNIRVERRLGETYSQTGDYLSAMLARVNKERSARGLPPLCSNKKLQSSSQIHSDDQAAQNYMAHEGSDGSTMEQRITQSGYDWGAVGENVAAGQADVDAVMDAWMNSPEHKENILGDYTMLGASYAFNKDSEYKHYWTQDFGKGDNEDCDFAISNDPEDQVGVDSDNQDQVAQNEDSVQDTPAIQETPVPKTEATDPVAPVAEVPADKTPAKNDIVTEAPCPEQRSTEVPVQNGIPATELPLQIPGIETPFPEEQTPQVPVLKGTPGTEPPVQSPTVDTETPGKVSAAKDCEPKF